MRRTSNPEPRLAPAGGASLPAIARRLVRVLLVLALVLHPEGEGRAQGRTADSLRYLLQTHLRPDTLRVQRLHAPGAGAGGR